MRSRMSPAAQGAGGGRLEQAPKCRTFCMIRGGTCGCMPQSPAHCLKLLDGRIDLIRLGQKHLSVDERLPARGEHGAYFVQRQTAGLTKRNKSQLVQHGRRKLAASPARAG